MVFPRRSPPATLMPRSMRSCRTMSTVVSLKTKLLSAVDGMYSGMVSSSMKSSS